MTGDACVQPDTGFQLVEDCLDQGSASQERLIARRARNRLHVFAHLGDEFHLLLAQSLDQPLGDIALVGIDPAKQVSAQLRDRLAVIDITRRDLHAQQFAKMIDGDMQCEAEEPAGRTLATGSAPSKHTVPGNAQVVADENGAGIENADASAFAFDGIEPVKTFQASQQTSTICS